MEPKLKAQILEWEKESPETAKKLLIRKGAMQAYKDGTIKNIVKSTTDEVIEDIFSVGDMSPDQVGLLIGKLERARLILATLTQGLSIAHADEVEPIIRKKRDQEEKEKKIRTKGTEGSLAALGISLADVMKALDTKKAIAETVNKKIRCEKCGIEMYEAMKDLHTCQ